MGGRINGQGFDIKGLDGDTSGRWLVREGRMPAARGETAVSQKLADRLGIQVGQRLSVEGSLPPPGVEGGSSTLEFLVVGRYVDIDGEYLLTTRDSLPPWVRPVDYLVRTKSGVDNHDLARRLIAASGGHFDPEVLDDTIAEVRDQFRPVLAGLNAVLFTVAGVNLFSSLLMNIRERQRDFAVLKTIGFTPGQVATSVLFGSTVLAVIAVAVGIPLGLLAARGMFDALSSAAGIGTGVGKMPGLLWLLPIVPGAVLVATLGSVVPARRAAGLQVTEALRYE
jgi:putative ABC transport system permease protein